MGMYLNETSNDIFFFRFLYQRKILIKSALKFFKGGGKLTRFFRLVIGMTFESDVTFFSKIIMSKNSLVIDQFQQKTFGMDLSHFIHFVFDQFFEIFTSEWKKYIVKNFLVTEKKLKNSYIKK